MLKTIIEEVEFKTKLSRVSTVIDRIGGFDRPSRPRCHSRCVPYEGDTARSIAMHHCSRVDGTLGFTYRGKTGKVVTSFRESSLLVPQHWPRWIQERSIKPEESYLDAVVRNSLDEARS